MSLDLCVWDKCNNRCRMCTNPDGKWAAWDQSYEYDYDSLVKRLEKRKDEILTFDSIYLSGGEPTINPRFSDLLVYLRDNFSSQRVKLLTNGRRFCYQDFAQEILAINDNFEIDLSIYGADEQVHDAITQAKNSFTQTTAGLANLLKLKRPGQVVGVRTVVTGLSYKQIDKMLMLVNRRFPTVDRVVVIFWEPEAQAVKNISEVGVTYEQARPYLDKLLPIIKVTPGARLYHLPLCCVSPTLWPYVWRTLGPREVEFLESCSSCRYKHLCLGVHKGYLENVGSDEFIPITADFGVIESGDTYRPIASVSCVENL
jgi:pyruvate-formate lyase-activating enzyme